MFRGSILIRSALMILTVFVLKLRFFLWYESGPGSVRNSSRTYCLADLLASASDIHISIALIKSKEIYLYKTKQLSTGMIWR
jgi:hypothetical protein